jgi:hypothetical protein
MQVQRFVVLLLQPYGLFCLLQLCCVCCQVDVDMQPLDTSFTTLNTSSSRANAKVAESGPEDEQQGVSSACLYAEFS